MNREIFEHIINSWKDGIPNRRYAETCDFWDENGEFTVYQAAGNPGEWGNKIIKKGPSGALELFRNFHDDCETYSYQVSDITVDVENKRAAWQVGFEGKRHTEYIKQELAFMMQLNDEGKIIKAFIWPGNP